jgi:hypothetical protein
LIFSRLLRLALLHKYNYLLALFQGAADFEGIVPVSLRPLPGLFQGLWFASAPIPRVQ